MSVHKIPASKASLKQNQFEFQVPGQKGTLSLPLLKFLPVNTRATMERLAKPIAEAKEADRDPDRDDLRAFGQWQIDMLERYAPGLTDLLDDDQLAWLMHQWGEAPGVTVGESSGSASS